MANPPTVNGVMTLTETETLAIKEKLIAIRDSFIPTEEQPIADTFYLTSEYNKANEVKINGDTMEYCLNYTPNEVV